MTNESADLKSLRGCGHLMDRGNTVRGALLAALSAFFVSSAVPALAQCDPKDFMIKDSTSIQASEQIQLAYVLTSSREQFEKAKDQLGLFSKLTFEQAKEAASKISQSTKFDYYGSYSINFLQQKLSPVALSAYGECLTKDREHPGTTAWLSKREGDYYTIKVFWVGLNAKGVAYNDSPIKVSNGQLIRAPEEWVRATSGEIVIRKKSAADAYVSWEIGGTSGGIAIVHDPAPIISRAITAETMMSVSSFHVSGKVCGGGSTNSCVRPSTKSSFLRPGSGVLGEAKIGEASKFSADFYNNSPEQICVRITQSTGCCECSFTSTARLTAVESYPDPEFVAAIAEANAVKTAPVVDEGPAIGRRLHAYLGTIAGALKSFFK